jgi:Bacterial Ig-like domain (group 2)
MIKSFNGLVVMCALALGVSSAWAQPVGDALVCYKSRPLGPRGGLPAFSARAGEVVIDTFSTARPEDQHKVDLRKSIGLCAPAGIESEPLQDPVVHLEAYALKVSRTSPRQPKHGDSLHEIVNRFGTLKVDVRSENRVLAPTAKALGTAGVGALGGSVDSFKCYDAKVARAARGALPFPVFTPRQVSLTDQFGTRVFKVKKLLRLCAPADVGGTNPAAPTHERYLVCYQVRVASTKPKQPKFVPVSVSTNPPFGPEALLVRKPDEICLPSFKDPVPPTPVPTATPDGGGQLGSVLAIHIGPKTRYVNPGGSSTFTATADLVGGGTENYSQKVIWTSNNPGVALAANAPGDRSRIAAVSPGIATISATDPVSGVTSTSTADDAIFNVPGALLSIALSPKALALGIGDGRSLVATGNYEGGVTRNITQQLTYQSNDPSVVTVANAEGNRSRVESAAPGTASISAVDAVTGVSSADSDGDALVTVLGALESITLSPPTKTKPANQFQNYIAIGHYAGGGTQNITQEVDYFSSDQSVAVAPNTPGNKGRVDTVAPGTATISASHPSGITTTAGGNDATLTVSAATTTLLSISLAPTSGTRSVGEFQSFTTTGHYEGGGTANITQQVTYVSSDPSVVSAPNTPGSKSRVEMLAPGTATISAIYTDPNDPQIEVSSTDSGDDANFVVLGDLERLTLGPTQVTRAANQQITFTATGYFGGGITKNLTQRVTYTSSDPAVAAAPNPTGNKSKVDTLSPGTATISAIDPVTGVSTTATGDDVTLTVIGALERISLGPASASRSPGGFQRYTATGHFGGGITQNLTQDVIYSSSDPSVADAPNDEGDRSRVDAIAPGTTTISAMHPTAGISTTDTGDDAQLIVSP